MINKTMDKSYEEVFQNNLKQMFFQFYFWDFLRLQKVEFLSKLIMMFGYNPKFIELNVTFAF